MIRKFPFLLLFLYTSIIYSQEIKIEKVEPPNWWVGMELNHVQLMVYGENLNGINAHFNSEKIKILNIYETDNSSYAFIDIEVPSDLKAGTYNLILEKSGIKSETGFDILAREKASKERNGFTPEDIIYLIMPDRFANGDPSNDVVDGYGKDLDRTKGIARHGGDIQGIIDHLDYIKDAGFTAIWINPVVENNTQVSYHGYGATDFYKVDPRLGTNELYKKLVEEAHKRGLKIILDHVANHIHINHPWMKNLPVKDWINGTPKAFINTNHDKLAVMDIHGDRSTLDISTRGWFTDYMPDLNQENPFMANYIIQNTIWWMEYARIDGIREDTYPYADPEFMSDWAKTIFKEYPKANIVGEVWKGEPVFLSAYQQESPYTSGLNTYLPSVTDFGLSDALRAYLSGSRTLHHVYETIAMDFVYHNPYQLVTFIDNHDVERAMFVAKENAAKVKIAMQILLTTRGIPQLLYGAEIGAVGGADHGELRIDFPGGFPGDKKNAFTKEGRTDQQNSFYDLVKSLSGLRKSHKALTHGKLVHFPPLENVYIYFRILDDEKIMIVVNDNKDDKAVSLTPVLHMLNGAVKLQDLKAGKEIEFNGSTVSVPAYEVSIYKVTAKN